MQAIATDPQVTPEVRELALRMSAVFLAVSAHDGGDFLREVEDSGLTVAQCRTLMVLARATADERRSAREIAAQIGITESTYSRAVEVLVKRGFVTRTEHEADRRQRRVDMTDEGARVVSSLMARKRAGVESFAAELTEEQRRSLAEALAGLLANDEVATAYERVQRRETKS